MTQRANVDVEQRAVVGVFADPARLKAAADELQHKGFVAGALGLVAPLGTAPDGIGTGSVEHVGQGPGGKPLAVCGTALRAVVDAAGAVSDPRQVLHLLGCRLEPAAEALPPGTMLLWVRVAGGDEERKAEQVLDSEGVRSTHRYRPAARNGDRDPLSGFEPDPFLPGAAV